ADASVVAATPSAWPRLKSSCVRAQRAQAANAPRQYWAAAFCLALTQVRVGYGLAATGTTESSSETTTRRSTRMATRYHRPRCEDIRPRAAARHRRRCGAQSAARRGGERVDQKGRASISARA